jgi:hypothetical protein
LYLKHYVNNIGSVPWQRDIVWTSGTQQTALLRATQPYKQILFVWLKTSPVFIPIIPYQ